MKRDSLLPLLLIVAASCGHPAAPQSAPPAAVPVPGPDAPKVAEQPARGFEERVNGIRVVHLVGSPEEMGEQMGTMCGEDLRYLIDANLKKIPAVAKDPAKAMERAKHHAAGIPDDQMSELRATARAAKVDEDWLVVAACVIEVVEELRACAAVAAWGTATASHETIVGRNLDWYDIGKLHERGLIVVRHPRSGRPFVSAGFPGLPGVLTGMNDAGLFTGDLVQYTKSPPPSREKGIPVMSLQRMVMERCATAAEAVALIESSPRTVPQNYVVADAKGALFVETDATEVRRREPVRDTVAGTNWAEEERGTLRGDARFGMLCQNLDPKIGALGVPEIEEALGAANMGPLSVMSVVALPAKRALRVSAGRVPACKGPFVDVDAAALLAKTSK